MPHQVRNQSESKKPEADLSDNRLAGNFEPGGKSGGGLLGSATGSGAFSLPLEEFPAFPDLTICFLGGMRRLW